MFTTRRADAQNPLVLAIDVGSTGTRAGVYDARGLPLRNSKTKVQHAFTTLNDGTSTIDPDQVADEIRRCINFCTDAVGAPIAGVAIDTFASSLVGVDADGRAITPCYTYADSRCAPQVNYLRSILDEDDTQQRTGTRQHTGYLPPRFLWLQQTDPDTFGRVRRWMSLGEYAWLRLIGRTAAGTSTADWTGMLNRRRGRWDAELCALVGVQLEQLSPIAPPDDPLTPRASVGERSTGWVGQARAVFHRVTAATTPLELYRGTIEGVAFSYQRILRDLTQVTGRPREILGTGRVSNSLPGLLQIVADASGAPVTPITIKRSTMHGTALMALETLAPGVERAEVDRGATFTPVPDRSGYYHRRMERFQVLYDKVISAAN